MEQKTELILSQNDLMLIKNNQFDLSLMTKDLPSNTQLTKVTVPDFPSSIYCFIENGNLNLVRHLKKFFKRLVLGENIYILLRLESNFDQTFITEIFFSLNKNFSDLKVHKPVIITKETIKKVKALIPNS
jgi:hypothetical protein